MKVEVPEKLLSLYSTNKRYVSIYGGRGSAKSWGVADFLLAKGIESKKRILCSREIQNSIKDSVHRLLCDRIDHYELKDYEITDKAIRGHTGTEFLFKGLKHNPQSVKSMEGIDYVWNEEAQNLSRGSLQILIPTIRNPESQIIFTYNPTNLEDPVHEDYTLSNRDDVHKIEMNYSDNPFFPDVLRKEMEYDKKVDYDKYLHIWEGQCVQHSEAQVFYGKWKVDSFDAPGDAFLYFGADWGFSNDPNALIRCFVKDKVLYIDWEAWGIGVDIDKTPELFDRVPHVRQYPIIADSARPETINYMKRQGFMIKGARKGKGSVEDGVQHIRSYEKIIIHERCTHTIDEFRNYCYKVDKNTEAISTVLEDKNNHCIDSLRYALENLMKCNYVKQTKVVGW